MQPELWEVTRIDTNGEMILLEGTLPMCLKNRKMVVGKLNSKAGIK